MACCEAEAEGRQNEEGRRTAGSSLRMAQPAGCPAAQRGLQAHPAWDQPSGVWLMRSCCARLGGCFLSGARA